MSACYGARSCRSSRPDRSSRCKCRCTPTGDLICIELEPAPPTADWSDGTQRAMAVMQSLRTASSQLELCNIVAAKLRELTGYDRVMVYRFHNEGHGEVIAESRDPDLEPYLGQCYPASDIPRQARRLYLAQRIRMIRRCRLHSGPGLVRSGLGQPSPARHDALRLARRSRPVHLEYMRNMGVHASLAVSLIPATSLWGMVVCHHREKRFIPADVRARIDMIGQLVSLLLGSLGEMETYAAATASAARAAGDRRHDGGLRAGCRRAAGRRRCPALRSSTPAAPSCSVGGRTLTFGTAPPVEERNARAMAVLDIASDGNAAGGRRAPAMRPRLAGRIARSRVARCSCRCRRVPRTGSSGSARSWSAR